MKRHLLVAAAAVATLLGATAAQAGHVDLSIGIAVPPLVAYAPRPYYVEPVPAYYAPPVLAPRVVVEAPVFAPRPRYWVPPVASRGWDRDGGRRGDRDEWRRDGDRDHDGHRDHVGYRDHGDYRGHDVWHHDDRADRR